MALIFWPIGPVSFSRLPPSYILPPHGDGRFPEKDGQHELSYGGRIFRVTERPACGRCTRAAGRWGEPPEGRTRDEDVRV